MRIEENHIVSYRYPGTKFFEPDQKDIFFGRKQETFDLIHSIRAHDVFVIFADSGIGKTSLLNAGLIPELLKENILAVKFRFQDTTSSPLQIITNKLSEYISPEMMPSSPEQQKLWRLFKLCVFKNEVLPDRDERINQKAFPLFIFDQFEEFFNHPKSDREECINELSDLVNDYLPDYLKEEMKEKFKEKDPTEKDLLYYTPARVKMLFLIRADKLKLLDDLSKKIPLILRNRFHLKPLNAIQAEQAILLPASLPANSFVSPSFSFQEEAVNEICRYLKNEEEEVESFQLQILCRELEKRIIDRAEKGENSLWISEAELGGDAGMDNIINNYYKNQINSILKQEDRKKAVLLIEEKLIVEDRRISLPEVLLLSEGYSKELLDYLLNTTRLIRVDNNRYVEISHDRLISSILKSKQQREKEEEKLREIEQLERIKEEEAEKNRQLQKQKEEEIKNLELQFLKDKVKKAARLRIYLIILVILLGISVLAIRSAYHDGIDAKIAAANMFIANQKYTEAEKVLNDKSWLSFLGFYRKDSLKNLRGQIEKENKKQKDYEDNSNKGDSLLSTFSLSLTTIDSLLLIANTEAEENNSANTPAFTSARNELKKMLGVDALKKARDYFIQAQQTEYTPKDEQTGAGDKLLDLDTKISYAFKQCIDAAYVFLKANDKEGAREAFQKGQSLYSFATDTTRNIQLSDDDTPYIDSLQKILNQ